MGSPVMQWQIVASDPDKVASFYATMFGWQVTTDNMIGYRIVKTGAKDGIDGGIWPAPPNANAFVQLFIGVEDVGAAVAQATALGARVIVPATKLPEGDEMAVLHDPFGMAFAVMRKAKA